MRRFGTASLALCLVTGLSSLPAPAQTAPATTAPPAVTDGSDRIICRVEPPPTGSHLGSQKVCATQAEWNALYHGDQKPNSRNNLLVPNNTFPGGGSSGPSATPHGGGHGL
ncbi:MAG TPA: hypothetical protein VGB91_15490 [Rhizomicrobium sp.]